MRPLDHTIVAWMSGLDLPLLTPLARLLSSLGSSGLVFMAVALVLSVARRRVSPLAATLVAVFASQLLSGWLKTVFDRPRPSVAHGDVHALVAVPASAAMPSGHAWIAFAAAVTLGGIAPRLRPWLLSLALLIALSRVYLGVHYPSDVLVGGLGGAATGAVVLLSLRRICAVLDARAADGAR